MSTDGLWERIKRAAAEEARAGSRPSQMHARALIEHFVRQEETEPLPADAVEFYASELLRLIDEYRNA